MPTIVWWMVAVGKESVPFAAKPASDYAMALKCPQIVSSLGCLLKNLLLTMLWLVMPSASKWSCLIAAKPVCDHFVAL